jgi:Asp-tRNA(Asn)/Glu-tRNA(Gln) amidotransferase A subunit family amidase
VAAREVPLAIGSQTAGSILRPAAYNGVVGFKPTFGRISRKGVVPAAWTLDHIGVLARGVEDCALFFAACAGHDPTDPYSADQPVPPVANVSGAARPPRLGLVREALDRSVPRVRTHLEGVARQLTSAGAAIREVSLAEPWDLAVAVHHLIMQTEMAGVHAELLERHVDAYSPRLRAYVETGRLIPGERYLKALRLRRRVRAAFDHALSGLDALLLPTSVDVAPGMETTGDAILQAPVTLVGLPSISLPSGLTDEAPRLPFAIQLVGHRWDEPGLLAAARWCEERLGPMPAPPL